MSKIEELEEKIRTYRWLQGIEKKYKDVLAQIEKDKDAFRLSEFVYDDGRGTTRVELNSNRSMPYTYIRDGIQVALAQVTKEIADLEKELNQ